MLHAAASFLGLFVIWLLLTQQPFTPADLIIGALAAVACVVVGLWFGGASRAYLRAPNIVALKVSRSSDVISGALTTLRRAVAADVSLRPALARVRLRSLDEDVRVTMADMVSASPGTLVVGMDDESLLVHLNDEDGGDLTALSQIEARATGRRAT